MSLGKAFQEKIDKLVANPPAELSSILFGMTGGLLSLVGLIAIYISLNSQHKIDKAREIIWSIGEMAVEVGNYGDESLKKLQWAYFHYRELVKVNFINKAVVVIAMITIIFVSVSWSIYIYSLKIKLWSSFIGLFTPVTIIIMLLFAGLLYMLTKIFVIGDIPRHENLFSLWKDAVKLVAMRAIILYHTKLDLHYFSDQPDESFARVKLPFGLNLRSKRFKIVLKKTFPYIIFTRNRIRFEFAVHVCEGAELRVADGDTILNREIRVIRYAFQDRRHYFNVGTKQYAANKKAKHSLFQELHFNEQRVSAYDGSVVLESLQEVLRNLEAGEERYCLVGKLRVLVRSPHDEYGAILADYAYRIANDQPASRQSNAIYPYFGAEWIKFIPEAS